jgi:hypothetical protein
MKNRCDLEQDILALYSVKEDLKTIQELILDRKKPVSPDEMSNFLLGVEHVLNLKIERVWDTFCQVHRLDNYNE